MRHSAKGFLLIEVLMAMVIIIAIAALAYRHHMTLMVRNQALTALEEQCLMEENEFDRTFGGRHDASS